MARLNLMFNPQDVMQSPSRAPIRDRLCCVPEMDDFTRRQALRLGAGALALGALRPSPALAATAPELFELPIADRAAHASGRAWRTTGVLRAPGRFDLVGLRWSGAAALEAQVRTRRAGGRWTAWTPLPSLNGHAPDGGKAVAGTDPAFVGRSDEL